MARPTDTNEQLLCASAAKPRQVKKLNGPRVYICDECSIVQTRSSIGADHPAQLDLTTCLGRGDLHRPERLRVGQEEAKRSSVVYNHYSACRWASVRREVELSKSNILLLGRPCGKTLLAQPLARILNVPRHPVRHGLPRRTSARTSRSSEADQAPTRCQEPRPDHLHRRGGQDRAQGGNP